jgi:hypothetical protein
MNVIPTEFQLPKDYLTKQLKDRDWPFDTPWVMTELRKCGWWTRTRLIFRLLAGR